METAKPDLEAVLDEMFTENTGTHFLDSGAAYGRHWERNQDGSYKNCDSISLTVYNNHFTATISTYHYLNRLVEPAPELRALFSKMTNLRPNDSWYELMDDFPVFAEEQEGIEVHGPHTGEIPVSPMNTYNWESLLSQEIQFLPMRLVGEEFDENRVYLLLQLHNGCDIRGGYTRPYAFYLTGYDGLDRMMVDCRSFHLTDGENHWDYYDHRCDGYDARPLEEFNLVTAEELSGIEGEENTTDPEIANLYSTIQTWSRKVESNKSRLTDELLRQHEDTKTHLWSQWAALVKAQSCGDQMVGFVRDWPEAGVERNTLISPINQNEIRATP